jgi:hypothetical protein
MSEVRARPTHALTAVLLLPLVLALSGCSSAVHTTAPRTTSTSTSTSEAGAPSTTRSPATTQPPPTTTRPPTTLRPTAPTTTRAPLPGPAAVLARLPTGALDHAPRYARTTDFGRAWLDADHNGCDTRNDILRRDLTGILIRTGTNGCVVVGGLLHDRYTGSTIAFSKAHATEVQIDHVVPLHDAWELGAYRWTQAEREAYANDPLVLLAVSGPENEAKGDKLADEWTPPDRAEWCDYATRTIAIHARYALPVTAGERQALATLLTTCP